MTKSARPGRIIVDHQMRSTRLETHRDENLNGDELDTSLHHEIANPSPGSRQSPCRSSVRVNC